ncbi:MAG TPA: TIGR02147 family protein [Fibrobacteria bacterium]|nr:TIGR02147 family protein [Fibrobacteria bacterium]
MDASAPPSPPAPPIVYQYDDFRLFLKDSFQARKHADPKYSYRGFAREAGIANPGYLLDVIIGKRTLSRNAADKAARAFGLGEAETEFFHLLVEFGQSRKEGERQAVYQDILYRRNRSRFARMSPKLVKYYQDFHYPLVRCALEAFEFTGDYEALAGRFDPPLAPAALRKYVRDLCEWNLAAQGPDGVYRVTEQFVEPPPTMAAMVRRLNREWILQAADAPFKFRPEDRHVSTMMLMVSEPTRKALREKIERFRKEVLEMVDRDAEPASGIMQLSLQYFPKTKRPR